MGGMFDAPRQLACSSTLGPVLLISFASCSVPDLGLRDGRLTSCPGSPNCVSSLAEDDGHRVDAFPLVKSGDETRAGLEAIIAAMSRTVLMKKEGHYLRFQFTTLIFRFKDDVEFHIVPADKLVHVRSSSRVGYYDFGVNRARVDAIRRAYDSWLANK